MSGVGGCLAQAPPRASIEGWLFRAVTCRVLVFQLWKKQFDVSSYGKICIFIKTQSPCLKPFKLFFFWGTKRRGIPNHGTLSDEESHGNINKSDRSASRNLGDNFAQAPGGGA